MIPANRSMLASRYPIVKRESAEIGKSLDWGGGGGYKDRVFPRLRGIGCGKGLYGVGVGVEEEG